LVRDLVCRTICPTCSSVSCWTALICSACASITAWSSKTKVILWPASHRYFLRLSLGPFRFCLQQRGLVDFQLLLFLLLKFCFLLECRWFQKSCVHPAK
jgi:hypothetical protein